MATLQSAFGNITYGTTYTAPGTIPHDGVTSSSSAFNSWLRSTVGSGTSGAWKKAVVPSGWTIRLTGTGGITVVRAGQAKEGEDDDHGGLDAPQLHRYAPRVAFQVWHEGQLVLRSANAPTTPMRPGAVGQQDGFETVTVAHAA